MKHLKLHILSLLAASIVLFMGCSADDTMDAGMDNANSSVGNVPITFNATVTAAATRAGASGNIDYSVLAREDYGFGVFAYGVEGGDWYNKRVTYDYAKTEEEPDDDSVDAPVENLDDVHMHTGNWSYGEEIMWGDVQMISFLAYAPYVSYEQIAKAKADAAAAKEDPTGIIGVNEGGLDETYIQYAIATDPTESVDLLWGVREDANLKGNKRVPWLNTAVSDAAGDDVKDTDGDDVKDTDEDDVKKVLNVTNGKGITFSFHHALAAIGFHVQAMIDKTNDTGDYEDESNVEDILDGKGKYKVTIKKITLEGDFYETADLNLNNEITPGKPNWQNKSGSISKLIVENENINESFKHPDDSKETDVATAEEIVESTTIKGVSQTAEQLVIAPNSTTGAEQCFFVIPNEVEADYTVTLEWCVSYKNAEGDYVAEDHENPIKLKLELRPEVKYYLNFVIGLKSVRLSVKATDWEDNPIYIEEIIEHGTSANESLAKKLR